ncbi:hypothetical protein COO59_18440 [Mixta theicola]|uniref:Methyltransferase type 11 domain-containing protein n=1 Tax=Mixta theicola TaxID=1458355 RepID=A0A2K1Q5A7_9GAMM|nr:class I SAM-dependent methyltransferase [Mixta theicola]PNS10220.1 hypothetical protein COO59_18440 [Mixta theicola]GLR11027.1 hypothetical protein GCM10007905_37470 [Mixta theicola]
MSSQKNNLMYELEAYLNVEHQAGKHTVYQKIARSVLNVIRDPRIQTAVRYEEERFDYIKKFVSLNDASVIDIGCNLGYFAFSSLEEGAQQVTCYEGYKYHAEFVEKAAILTDVQEKLIVKAEYYDFSVDKMRYDVAFLLNVLHHVGDDYGDKNTTCDNAKKLIAQQINNMATIAQTLVFQLGFNWRGDKKLPLFAKGLKDEVIDFVSQVTQQCWEIKAIGIAVKNSMGRIEYRELDDNNRCREDTLGEFLNRPLFIMERKD